MVLGMRLGVDAVWVWDSKVQCVVFFCLFF